MHAFPTVAQSESEQQGTRPFRILVVDDDPSIRKMILAALRRGPYQFLEAPNGKEALDLMRSDHPDVVVLDLMMPGVDGYEVRRELEAHAHTRSIPIVVVTAAPPADPGVLNVQCVLVKPVLAIDLVAAVKRCLASGSAAGV